MILNPQSAIDEIRLEDLNLIEPGNLSVARDYIEIAKQNMSQKESNEISKYEELRENFYTQWGTIFELLAKSQKLDLFINKALSYPEDKQNEDSVTSSSTFLAGAEKIYRRAVSYFVSELYKIEELDQMYLYVSITESEIETLFLEIFKIEIPEEIKNIIINTIIVKPTSDYIDELEETYNKQSVEDPWGIDERDKNEVYWNLFRRAALYLFRVLTRLAE